jgi:hypothetical protein
MTEEDAWGITGAIPFWVTLTVCPATVSVPMRVPTGNGLTNKSVRPLPLPAEPEVTVIQLSSLLLAVQAQPAAVVMVTLQLVAAIPGGTVMLVGLTW